MIFVDEEQRIIECATCGAPHQLESDDSSCQSCGQLYNAFGQRLQPPHMWEEDL